MSEAAVAATPGSATPGSATPGGTAVAAGLPVLDLRRLDAGPGERGRLLSELRAAARHLGFFYVEGHGIDAGLQARVLELSRRFFSLPEEEKRAVEMVHSPHFRGYTRVGFEHTRGRRDWREQLDVGSERAAYPRDPSLPPWTRLQGPNQWPASLPDLKPVLLRYQAEATRLATRLLRAFAEALGQPEGAFDGLIGDLPGQLVKIIRYPGRETTEDDQGVGPHKDSGLVTVLLQGVQSGLQVETEAGWIDAPPRPGTYVVNMGELLELASSGYLRATVHRVVTPPARTERLSVAFFLGARLDATVEPLSLPGDLAADTRGVSQDPLNPLFFEVGRNYLKGRLRSHPDVARRHHADLLTPEELGGSPIASSGY